MASTPAMKVLEMLVADQFIVPPDASPTSTRIRAHPAVKPRLGAGARALRIAHVLLVPFLPATRVRSVSVAKCFALSSEAKDLLSHLSH